MTLYVAFEEFENGDIAVIGVFNSEALAQDHIMLKKRSDGPLFVTYWFEEYILNEGF